MDNLYNDYKKDWVGTEFIRLPYREKDYWVTQQEFVEQEADGYINESEWIDFVANLDLPLEVKKSLLFLYLKKEHKEEIRAKEIKAEIKKLNRTSEFFKKIIKIQGRRWSAITGFIDG